ncbi:MAG: hypothetical protein WBF28_00250 [Atribacterota bacterium]
MTAPSAFIFIYEAVSFTFGKYGLPYGLSVSLCKLHLMVTHFDATLGMGGWLDLTQQGLSPCKTYKTSWRSFAKSFRIINPEHLVSCHIDWLLHHFKIFNLSGKSFRIKKEEED